MSFRQPTSTAIRSFHFRGNAYEFLVESLLESKPVGGQLLIEASTGYELTTSVDTVPHSQQMLNYTSQTNGSWLARSMVTLLASGPSLISGTVKIREPLGETVILLITIEPLLFLDSTAITFNRIESGEETFAMLKISQQGANTPVVLSTDIPNPFALATNRQELNYTTNLTVTPSIGGIYIYIRYAPNQFGRHMAHLYVKTSYDTKVVLLEGQSGGILDLLSWTQLPHRPSLRTRWGEPVARRVQQGILAILLIGGLTYMGYYYQCQLFPSLCQAQNAAITTTIVRDSTIGYADVHTVDTNTNWRKNTSSKNTELENKTDKVAPQLSIKPITREPSSINRPMNTYHQSGSKRRIASYKKSAKRFDEPSDLEKELNKKTYNYR